jgi:hypothetical protein
MSLTRSAAPLGNPANLCSDSIKEISLTYAGYFQNTFSTSGLSFISPVDNQSSVGVSASYLLVPGIEIHEDTVVPQRVPTKSSSDLFFRLGYGRTIITAASGIEVRGGAAINAERMNLINWTGYGIGADAGVSAVFSGSGAAASLLIENITAGYTHWSRAFKSYAYPHIRFGAGWQREFPYIYGKINAGYLSPDLLTNDGINFFGSDTLDENSTIQHPEIKSVKTNPLVLILGCRSGVEYTIMDRISFRIGLYSSSFSFGGGLSLLENRAGFDFAYLSHELAPTYKLSVHFRWR